MKRSLNKKLAFTFTGLMLVMLLAIGLINTFFLESYYTSKKEDMLRTVYGKINELVVTSNVRDSDVTSEFRRYCSEKNISWVASDYQSYRIVEGRESDVLYPTLFGYINGLRNANGKAVKQTDDYIIQKIQDTNLQTDYLEMWGKLENSGYFLIRTPVGSIRDSVQISNMFYIYIGLVMILISIVIILLFSRRITKPITELTDISRKMADLDFNARYTSGGQDEIGILGDNFNRMSRELETAISGLKSANNELQKDIEKKIQVDEMRKEFLSNVSHELKTPIALIQGYAEGLKECINEDEESRDFYCDVIIDESAKMNEMVKKLLTLNQLEFGKDQVTMERFELTELIRGVVQSTRILAEQKEVRVIFQEENPVYVWGDEFKIEEVVTNYVSNALNHVKYSNTIEIRILQEERKVRVTVFNTGDPIPEEDLDKIWIKFYKVDKARTREYGGSGIGLSIVKAIMDSMNQKCGVQNYDNGVEFWFELEKQ